MRRKVKEEIYRKRFPGGYVVRYSDLPKGSLEGDIVDIVRNEGFSSENNSLDAFTELVIFREREENDKEYQERMDFWDRLQEQSKKARYEDYLQLKAEFEK